MNFLKMLSVAVTRTLNYSVMAGESVATTLPFIIRFILLRTVDRPRTAINRGQSVFANFRNNAHVDGSTRNRRAVYKHLTFVTWFTAI